MTEDEAKTKWCPFARVTDIEGTAPSANRYSNDGALHPDDEFGIVVGSHCIASKCMAWRWYSHGSLTPGRAAGDGYCGLASKP